MAHDSHPSINLPELADELSGAELDELPFGLIQLSPTGEILEFNETEGSLTGTDPEWARGRNFFSEVAPCTRVQEFHGRFLKGVEDRELHEVFPFRFAFRDGREKDVVVTLFYSRRTETVWVAVTRGQEGSPS